MTSEAGADGESWLRDVIGGGPDVNPELTGSAKFAVYDEMGKTDPSIKSLLMFIGLPIRSAVWGLNPSDEGDQEARFIRDAVAWNFGLEDYFGETDLSWDALTQQALSMLQFGPCIEEIVWDDVRTFHDRDGDEHLIRPIARLALRPATTIAKVKREKGKIVEITQSLPGTTPIPGMKGGVNAICYDVFEHEAGRWDGVSMLRPAWLAWRSKKALQIAAGIGWDRFASGLPVIFHPDDPDSEARARRIGRSIRNHERGYVHFPISDGQSRQDSAWWLELLNGAQTLGDPTPLLRYFSEQEAEAGLQQFSKLGMTETGSRSVGETQIDPFYLAVSNLADKVRRERARQVFRSFVEHNFGREAMEKKLPILTVSKIRARNVEVIARALAELAPLGFTFTDRGVQDDVREMLGFGKLPDDLQSAGIDKARLEQMLKAAGMDPAKLAELVNSLPDEIGIARNRDGRVPVEGDGLGLPTPPPRKALPRANEDERPPINIEVVLPELPAPEVRFEEGAIKVEGGDVHVPPSPPQPPVELNLTVNGERRTGATVTKENGKTVVRYEHGD